MRLSARNTTGKIISAAITCQVFLMGVELAASATELEKTVWKTGQVLATSEMSSDPSTFFFEVGTGSRYGHVGIVAAPETGATLDNTFVYEATPPVAQKTPLRIFLQRASSNESGAIEATLLEPARALTAEENKTLIQAMEEIVSQQVPYNYSAVINSATLNCSEFVRKVFSAIGREVGVIEKFEEMNTKAFGGKLLPLFGRDAGPGARVVTPVSIVHSQALNVVTANLPVGSVLSEAEIYAVWEKRGALAALSDLMGIPPAMIGELKKLASKKPYRALPNDRTQP